MMFSLRHKYPFRLRPPLGYSVFSYAKQELEKLYGINNKWMRWEPVIEVTKY